MVSDGLSVAGFTAGALLWMPCFTIFGPAREAPGCDLGGVMMGTSMVTLALVPATIHLFHGQPLAALGSIGVRALAVGVTAVAPDDNRVSVFLFAGLAAIIIDWTVLAREDTERPHDTGTFSPTLQLDQHGGALGVQGAF